jgi:outer membrane protein TolC
MAYDEAEELRAAAARCRATERALVDAQRQYRQAQEQSARAETERVRAVRSVARAESTLMALVALQDATVAELTAVLERQAPPRAVRPPEGRRT